MILIQFDDHGAQIAMKNADLLEDGWHVAPENADFTCRFHLSGEEIVAGDLPVIQGSMNSLIAEKTNNILQICSHLLGQLKAGYCGDEVLSWDQQLAEARAFKAGDSEPVLLSAIAKARGIPLATLVTRVLGNAAMYAQISGSIIGHKQYLEDAIAAATDVAELAELDCANGWPTLSYV